MLHQVRQPLLVAALVHAACAGAAEGVEHCRQRCGAVAAPCSDVEAEDEA